MFKSTLSGFAFLLAKKFFSLSIKIALLYILPSLKQLVVFFREASRLEGLLDLTWEIFGDFDDGTWRLLGQGLARMCHHFCGTMSCDVTSRSKVK